jgi:hypothetical protein
VKILVSGATSTVEKHLTNPNLGVLLTPRNRNNLDRLLGNKISWAVDNAAFSDWNEEAFCKLICKIARKRQELQAYHDMRCAWIAAPDVVGDHEATLRKWQFWGKAIWNTGLVPAFVAQDGCTPDTIPYSAGCVFIGGTTEFKLGDTAADIVRSAREAGQYVHMGRVNSLKRLRYAYQLGCDSVDGSSLSRFPGTYIPKFLKWLDQLEEEEGRQATFWFITTPAVRTGQQLRSRTGARYTIGQVDGRGFEVCRVNGKTVKVSFDKVRETKNRLEAGEEIPMHHNRGISYTVAVERGVVHALRDIIEVDTDRKVYRRAS